MTNDNPPDERKPDLKVLPPPTEPIIQFFKWDHLPEPLARVSRNFEDLAQFIMVLPRNPERTVALRKLLEAKDAAVRAQLFKVEV